MPRQPIPAGAFLTCPAGRDPRDCHTIDLEQWLVEERERRADRLRATHPELPMVQLPLSLYDRAG